MVNQSSEHLPGYQARDFEVVDYQLYHLSEVELWLRGPQCKLADGQYLSCLGAAQTFGCFAEHPYPELLGNQLGVTALNLGYGGAGPRFFNRYPKLIDIVNRGQLAIVQVMSGRSEDNSRFESRGLEYVMRRGDGKRMSADAAWRSILELRYAWQRLPVGRGFARRVCRAYGAADARRLLLETRANWIESYRQLFASIRVPTILLWFSMRLPDYQESFEDLQHFYGIYPQLVTREMVGAVASLADDYVECKTDRGSPQLLLSRFDGSPVEIDLAKDRDDFAGQIWTHNRYYPSPEMHEDAAIDLQSIVERYITESSL